MIARSKAILALLAAMALTAALLAVVGCGSNSPSSLLVPTGIRPAPLTPTGGLFGFIAYDTVTYVGLGTPPYPPTTVQLFRNAIAVDTVVTGGNSRRFEFSNLAPGDYSIVVRAHAFRPGGFGLFRVVDLARDAGNLSLGPNTTDSLASTVYVIGDMPGYTVDEINTFSTYCDGAVVGVWTFPNVLFTPVEITAGTHRVKFVTDASSTAGNLIGWGSDSSTTLSIPAINVPARFGAGPATDIVANFPSTGVYAFTFDERRLVFSINLVTGPTPATSRERASAPPLPRRIR